MKNGLAFLLLLTLSGSGLHAQAPAAASPTTCWKTLLPGPTAESKHWRLFLDKDAATGSDRITLANHNWTESFIMLQGAATPARFELTYNTLKDGFINDDKITLIVWYQHVNGKACPSGSAGPGNPLLRVDIQTAP